MSERFRVTSTNKALNEKIQIKIMDDTNKIYWYIKFNLELDKSSVTNDTMQVMDTDGYIMRTYIAYDTTRHVIVVSPIDSYAENKYYILSISKDVRSAKGKQLKQAIHILFKLVNNQISKYEVLKGNVKVPPPKPRPHNYNEIITKVYTFSGDNNSDIGRDALGFSQVKINVVLPFIGIAVIGVGFFVGTNLIMGAGVALCILGVLVIAKQAFSNRSKIHYNMGASNFNNGNYKKAEKRFKKALRIDENNEKAEYALSKVKFYI